MLTCWGRLYRAERAYTLAMAAAPSPHEAAACERRLSAAQVRWLRAVSVLTHVRRLARPLMGRYRYFQPGLMRPLLEPLPGQEETPTT